MRIVQITAGAASMYCGSCLRDNALAAAVKALGHDVTLVPLYTPTLTDEINVSADKVFYGGISIYLQHHSALFRHTPWLLDKLWDSRWALKAAARRTIPVDPKFLGELTVEVLEGEHGHLNKELAKLLRWLEREARPDVLSLPYTLVIALAAPIKRALGCPVCCTLQGEDLFLEGLLEPYRTRSLELIRRNIEHVDGFMAVSQYYAAFMREYLGIPAHKMDVVPLGINLDGYPAAPAARSGPFRIGYFARIAPEKGLHLLADAYRLVRAERDECRLEVAGYVAAEHRLYLESIERQMMDWGFGAEFRYHGVLDRRRKIEFLAGLDVLSVPSPYHDPKGIYCLEAMAAGTPVVEPRHGGFPEIIERTGGGVLVEPESVPDLARALSALAADRRAAMDLGRAGHEGVRREYPVESMAERAVAIYTRLREPLAVSA